MSYTNSFDQLLVSFFIAKELPLIVWGSAGVSLLMAAINDFRQRMVSDKIVLASMLWFLLVVWPAQNLNPRNLVWGFLLAATITIAAMILDMPAGGDIKCFMVLGCYLGSVGAGVMLFASFIALSYMAILRKLKKTQNMSVPFMPFAFLGLVFIFAVNCFF